MDRYSAAPPADLAPLVDRFWGWRSAADEVTRLPLHAPGVGAELFFHLGRPFVADGRPLSAAHVLAMRTRALDLAPARDLDFVAIRFRAGGLRHALTLPPAELPEGTPEATMIWGPEIDRLLERLFDASGFNDRCRVLAGWLRAERDRHSRPDAAADLAMTLLYADPVHPRIDRVAREAGLGLRQLERRFTAAAGIGPKRFELVARSYKLVRAQALDCGRPYLARALDLGYYDQAHAIHDLRRLTGRTPAAFFGELAARSHFYNPPRASVPSF